MQSRDWTDEFNEATEGRQSYDPPPPSTEQPPQRGVTRETRDRIFRIIKDRTGVSVGQSSDDEFVG